MRRTVIIFGLLVLVMVPIALYVVQRVKNPVSYNVFWPMVPKTQSQARYSVESQVPGFTIKLLDTQFLDYIANNIGIFKPNAVIDPQAYNGGALSPHTITHVTFVIVPSIPKFKYAVAGQKTWVAFGDYTVSGTTLVLRVAFNPNETSAVASGPHTDEDTFLRASLTAMYYAHGMFDPKAAGTAFLNIKQGIQQYLDNNVVPWPIQITRTP